MGNCCCGPIVTESCGWPRGTVRAMMAVIGIVVCLLVTGSAELIFIFRNEYVYALGIQNVITGVISIIIGYYFGSKSSQAATDALSDASEKLMAAKDREISIMREEHERSLRNIRNVRVGKRKKEGTRQGIVLPVPTLNKTDDTVINMEDDEAIDM